MSNEPSLNSSESLADDSRELRSDVIKQQLDIEIEKQKEVIEVQESEIIKLKQDLFGADSEVSSSEQLHRASVRYHEKEDDLKQQIFSIQALETTLDEMEKQITTLTQQKEKFESELDAKKYEMRRNIGRLIHIERLIEILSKEITEKKEEYKSKIDALEAEKQCILGNPNLSAEEKKALINELNKEMIALINGRESLLELYATKLDDLETEAKQYAAILKESEHDIAQFLQAELNELEKCKIGASPSEILRIDDRIAQLKQQHQNNLNLIDIANSRKEHFTDNIGRYFINEKGQKVYQRHSNASEYISDENGQLFKISENQSTMISRVDTDEHPKTHLADENAATNQFFVDDNGRFFVDSWGRKIYRNESGSFDYILIDGVMVKINKPTMQHDSTESTMVDETDEASGFTESATSLEKERRSQQEYIKQELGRPLRLALAAAAVNQPADPIDFIANYLLQYRYNQIKSEQNEVKYNELQAERDRICRESQIRRVKKKHNDKCSPCNDDVD